ncbi:Bifunctional transcriptional activator/DNA repair enzyme Ada [Vanrija pseudolonga]|uniref:Methylated-DNA--protein-cysteine methyltransferase n=1 Tax=Vanrija pseudolonga TaxID=143232 RepID=A0AAF0Y198_9TREE|nr:Bifunctional transcriptional activator/DNA repair enzyme Ada [Vanrija pseudolonga]
MPRPTLSLSPITYTTAEHALGTVLIATSSTALAAIALADTPAQALADLKTSFPGRRLVPAKTAAAHETHHDAITAHLDAGAPLSLPKGLEGTPFQRAVWAAIAAIPHGETRTYAQLATSMGRPNATRAVARACATNRLALVIPCHRVLGAGGKMTGYRWGVERKRALLNNEQR